MLAFAWLACADPAPPPPGPPVDPDGDLDDDGFPDADELACASDPADPAEVCYACGWPHAAPDGLAATGAEVGDVVADLVLWDQCREPLRLHDRAGSYVHLFATAMWCTTCLSEAAALGEEAALLGDETGLAITPLVVLFQGVDGGPPTEENGFDYADYLGIEGFPVTADVDQGLIGAVPYDGVQLPGKCLLSPEMRILGCFTGSGGEDVLREWMLADAAR